MSGVHKQYEASGKATERNIQQTNRKKIQKSGLWERPVCKA